MKHRGRRPASTREQRQEVLRLLEEGKPRRRIAEMVFGDERLRARVDRIAREAKLSRERANVDRILEGGSLQPETSDAGEEDLPTLEELFGRYARSLKRRLEDPDERVTAGELETFARLERRIENGKTLERLRALTRVERD